MEERAPRVRAFIRVGLAVLAATVIPAMSWAQDFVVDSLIRDIESQYADVEAQIRLDQAKALKTEAERLKALLATLEQNRAKLLAHMKDVQSSLSLMRVVAADRVAASKLLDAMKQRNAIMK